MQVNTNPRFMFAVCQVGAEAALKWEIARRWPDFRASFSRPGFVTFKLPEGHKLAADFDLGSTFARTYGFSLGKLPGADERLFDEFWKVAGAEAFQHLHVWQRDTALPGDKGFEPGISPLAAEVAKIIAARRPASCSFKLNQTVRSGESVLDCVIVEPGEWWLGFHRASSMPSRWPGGVPEVKLPADAVTRAYRKTVEALKWSRLPVRPGDRCAEIGSAPGGAAQALLERGLHVTGIDPAEIDPIVLGHANFAHIRARGREVRRREFRGISWLFADSNVAPKHTLDTVEDIISHPEVHVRGMLLTLKLFDWKLAEQIPDYLTRVRSWGFSLVKARQLAYNRHEICFAALRNRAMRRIPLRTAKKKLRRRQPH